MPHIVIALLLALGLFSSPTHALNPVTLDATVAGGVYRVTFDALIDAPIDRVAGVLVDFVGYAALDPRIRSSEVVGSATDGAPLLKTRIRACAAFFCRDIRRVERITVSDGVLVATAIPGQSDVRRSVARTEWRADGSRTRIRYEAEFVPDFWVPAVVSRRYAAPMLRESVLQLFQNVEERAREP
ncbi:MAG TPA: SRPBCC family protein [Steroidobacteraceae bacterium]|nr:SRPBCC family protein [Steroidobacteraceae bacterium]